MTWRTVSGWLLFVLGIPLCLFSVGGRLVASDGWLASSPYLVRWGVGVLGLMLLYGGWERAH